MKKEENKEKNKNTTKASESKKTTKTTKKETERKQPTQKKQENKNIKKKEIEEVEKTNVEEVEEFITEELDEKESQSIKQEPTKKTKTNDIILIGVLVVVVILGLFFLKGTSVTPGYELPLTLTGEVGLHQLTYQEYKEKVDNDESFVLIIERATCSHCVNFMPVAENFATENNVPMYYVDTDTFTNDEWSEFITSNTYLKKNSNSWGTPTTIVLAGRDSVNYIEGETTTENLKELYNEYFDISEE